MAIQKSGGGWEPGRRGDPVVGPVAGVPGSGTRAGETDSGSDSEFDFESEFPPALCQLGVEMEPVRMEKVAEIRRALKAGTYQVSAWDVAGKMCARGWATGIGQGSSGNRCGRADGEGGSRGVILAAEHCNFLEKLAGGPEEPRRVRWERRKLPDMIPAMGAKVERMNRDSREKFCNLIRPCLAAALEEEYMTALSATCRSKRGFPEAD